MNLRTSASPFAGAVRFLMLLAGANGINGLKFIAAIALLTFGQVGRAADPLDTWIWRNPSPTGNALSGIAYGNGQFVTVGEAGTILTSVDGVNWAQQQSGYADGLSSVAYGSSQFVAFGGSWHGATILTSYDGTNWVQHPSPEIYGGDLLGRLVYGNGVFVALGWSDSAPPVLFTSADGVNWGLTWQGKPHYLGGVTYGDSQFVAVEDGGLIVTSADGTNWVQHQSSSTNMLNDVAYGDGQFVTVGELGTILTSIDGVNWTHRESQSTNFINSIAHGNGVFIASDGYHEILTSTDAVNWAEQQAEYAPAAIAYGNGQFVSVGDGILSSTDGMSWVQHQLWTREDLAAITYGDGQFVAVGYNSSRNSSSILTSTDGISWLQRQAGTPASLSSVIYGNGQFVAVGESPTSGTSGAILTSTNGVNWLPRQSSAKYRLLVLLMATVCTSRLAGIRVVSVLSSHPLTEQLGFSASREQRIGLQALLMATANLLASAVRIRW
jgi:hypothetical protein